MNKKKSIVRWRLTYFQTFCNLMKPFTKSYKSKNITKIKYLKSVLMIHIIPCISYHRTALNQLYRQEILKYSKMTLVLK